MFKSSYAMCDDRNDLIPSSTHLPIQFPVGPASPVRVLKLWLVHPTKLINKVINLWHVNHLIVQMYIFVESAHAFYVMKKCFLSSCAFFRCIWGDLVLHPYKIWGMFTLRLLFFSFLIKNISSSFHFSFSFLKFVCEIVKIKN